MSPHDIEKLLADNQWLDAIKLLERIPEPRTNEQLSAMAWCYSRSNQFKEAIKIYNELIKRQPENAKWHYGKGYQFYMQKNWIEAIECFLKALSFYPNYFVVKYRIAYAYLQISGNTMQWSKDSFWKAIHHLEECHVIYSSYGEAEKKQHDATYAKVCVLHSKAIMSSDRYVDKAIELLKRAQVINPNDDICYQLAKALFLKKSYEEALEVLPQKENPYYFPELRSLILSNAGRYSESNKILNRLTQFRKKDYLYRRMAENFFRTNQLDKAEACSNKAIALNAKNYKNYLIKGSILEKKGMHKSAIDVCEKARKYKQHQFHVECSEAVALIDEIMNNTNNKPIDNASFETDGNEKCHKGQIVSYKEKRGFGFIADIQTDNKVFFHISDCPFEKVQIGQMVSYEIKNTPKGEKATKIVMV